MKPFKTSLDTKRLRRNVIGGSLVFILLFTIAYQFFILREYERLIDEKISAKIQEADSLYNTLMKQIFNVHISIIQTNLNIADVTEAFARKERERLHALLEKSYRALSTNYPNLNIMHFVLPDNRSLLRYHRLEKHGDDLSDVRPMHKLANATQTYLHGLEIGKYGISYRSIFPVSNHGLHIGTLELGSPVETVINEMQAVLDLEMMLVIKKEYLTALQDQRLLEFDSDHALLFRSPLFSEIEFSLSDRGNVKVESKENHYLLVPALQLYDFSGKNIARVIFALDITHEAQLKQQFAITVALGAVLLMLVVGWMLNLNFSKVIQHLERSEFYSNLILNSQQNIVIVSDGNRLLDANQAFLHFFNYKDLDAFLEEHDCVCDYFQKVEDRKDYIQEQQIEGVSWVEFLYTHTDKEYKVLIEKEGKRFTFALHAKSAQLQNRSVAVVVFHDITHLEEQNLALEQLSSTDPLTNIANRMHFNKMLDAESEFSRQTGQPLSLIFLDIDHFKMINDTYGHERGDIVLKTLSALLRGSLRKSDTLARWGGEEFVLILPKTTREEAAKLAEKLRRKIEAFIFEEVATVTCSFGVTQFGPQDTKNSFLRRVDRALYQAKRSGRNRIEQA